MNPTFLSEEKISFGDLEIFLLQRDNFDTLSKEDDIFFMLKGLAYIHSYESIREEMGKGSWPGPAANVLEVGVFKGASTAFLHRFFDIKRLTCIEYVKDPPRPLERYKASCAPEEIRTYYGIDQADTVAVTRILNEAFDAPIDLVVDDASHRYEPTKATFEAVFPYVRPGGIYVIEDWGWSHDTAAQQPDHYLADQLALSNLVLQLVVASSAGGGFLEAIGFLAGLMWVRKSWKELPKGGFKLDDYLPLRGRTLNLI